MNIMLSIGKKIFSSLIPRPSNAHRTWKCREKYNESSSFLKYYYWFRYSRRIHRFQSYLPISVKFAGEPVFPHDIMGIFVALNAEIGKNCVIFQQVTIGTNYFEGSKNNGAPQIGDNVIIGAGAKIVGGVKVGNNVRIGANCVVVTDIPDNATVVMEKSRVIMHEEKRDNSFYLLGEEKISF